MTIRPLIALAAVILLSGVARAADEPARPNVVIVLTDDQGYGDLGCHGNPYVKTPHLDRLHAESIRLTDFHVAPMCTPTRGQLLSGLDALRNGAMNVSSGRTLLRRGLPTIANFFADAGYRCGVFGKWHLGDNYPFRPHDRGFHDAVYYPSSHIGSAPDYFTNHYFNDTYWHNGQRKQYTGYTTDVFFDEAMKWMARQAAEGQPFLCYIPTAAAHGPLLAPEEYRKRYEGLDYPGVPPAQQQAVSRFFGMIANIDDNMGRLEESSICAAGPARPMPRSRPVCPPRRTPMAPFRRARRSPSPRPACESARSTNGGRFPPTPSASCSAPTSRPDARNCKPGSTIPPATSCAEPTTSMSSDGDTR